MAVERSPSGSSLIDVLDRVLDKGIVIDAWVRVSLVGIDLVTVEARIVVASIDTYLKYSEAVGITAPVSRPRELVADTESELERVMGDVSGIELARELRTLPAYRDLPIVLISADTEERTQEQARRAGVDDFIAKPIAAPDLRACIARHLERQRIVRLSEGRHPGTGLALPPRTTTDVAEFVRTAAAGDKTLAMVVVRPDGDDLAGDAAMGWLRETQRIANAVAGSTSVVGYHEGVSLMAVIECDGEIAESLFEALVFGRVDGAPAWRCGIADTEEVPAEIGALRRAADEAIEIARQDRSAFVRRWRSQEAGLAPDIILIEDDAALSDMLYSYNRYLCSDCDSTPSSGSIPR